MGTKPEAIRSRFSKSLACTSLRNSAHISSSLVSWPCARRLHVEQLEDRRMLAVLTVNSAVDNLTGSDGLVTLREAIIAANNDATTDLGDIGSGADTIVFDANVFDTPQSILLSLGEIDISEALTIDATAVANVTIDAQQNSRIFNITAASGDFTLAGLTLTGGRTIADGLVNGGGAIRSSTTGNLTIEQSTVSGNSTAGQNAFGGGIRSYGDVTLSRSTISGNSTADDVAAGGGIQASGDVTLTQSTISGNSTAGSLADGGGIFSYGDVTLTQSTVSGNSTAGNLADGGGIVSTGTVKLMHSTVTDNHANYANATGGGIWNSNDSIVITNSIVAGNTAGGGMDDIEPGTGALNVDFSLIEQIGLPLVGGDNEIGNSANLGRLANNGGPTQTHAPLAGSLVIDNGDPSIVFDPAEFDQRGAPFVRVFDDPVALGSGIDMGAYERQTVSVLNLEVDTTIDENDGDYSAGDLSLREAVGLANGSVGADTVTFDPAVFTTPQTIALELGEIEISEALTIDATAVANVTIDAQQQSRVINITTTIGDITLAGLTFTGGQTLADGFLGRGGAILSKTTGDLALTQSTVSGNSTAGSGAFGGGIYSKSAVTLTQSTVSGNSTAGNSAYGGGIFSSFTVTLTESTVSGNSTTGDFAQGGGIYSRGVTLTQSTVSGNSTAGDFADGGGIYSYIAVTLTQSTVSRNTTAGDSADGGGIASVDAVTLMLSTITKNHAFYSNATGGGVWNDNDTIIISNSIVAENSAGGDSPDLRPGTGSLFIDFSLIGDNDGTGLTEAPVGSPDVNDNLVGGAVNGVIDPLLGPLANNGGLTQTHALLTDSPAIDAGDSSIVFNPGEFDQRGDPFVRVFDDPVATGSGIDIGAYERQTVSALNLVVDTANDVNDGDYSVGDLSLREAVGLASGSVGADTVTFDATVFDTPQTVALELGEIDISEALTIDATAVASVTIDAQHNSRIFVIVAASGDFTLAGLTLTGGRTTADGIVNGGGAIRSYTSGNLTIDQSTVSGNSTTGNGADGGGIYSRGAFTLTQSTVSGNSTTGDSAQGGGFRSTSDVTLSQSTVSGNSTAGDLAPGGGIHSFGDVTLTQSIVSGNSTAGSNSFGGGIYSSDNVMLTQSTVSGNSTTGTSGEGGGIRSTNDVTVIQSTVSGNSTTGDSGSGGGIVAFGDVTLTESTISGNSTTGIGADGGGIRSIGAVTLNHSTVSGNSTAGSSAEGGAILSSGAVTLMHSTITDNHATDASATGGGIWNLDDLMVITNSIVAGNTAGGGRNDIDPGTGSLDVDFSLIGDNDGTGLLEAPVGSPDVDGNLIGKSIISGGLGIIDPLLGALSDNGGPTQTHPLLTGSPAIDAGDSSIVFNPAEFDQRLDGFFRVIDGDALGGARMDIGAFELQPATSADFVDDDIINGADFLAWQRGFGIAIGAMRSDGDADNDGDVDTLDLAVWEATYGQVETTPLVAAVGSPLVAPVAEPVSTSQAVLIDAALALVWLDSAADENETQVVEQSDSVEVPLVSSDATRTVTPTKKSEGDADDPTRTATPSQAEMEPWLTDDLLERAFG